MSHPYIGIHGRVKQPPYTGEKAGENDYTGVVVHVAQAGTTSSPDDYARTGFLVLRDSPGAIGRAHSMCDGDDFVPDSVEDARARLIAALDLPTYPRACHDEPGAGINPPPGWEWAGDWFPSGAMTSNGVPVWRRAVRKVAK